MTNDTTLGSLFAQADEIGTQYQSEAEQARAQRIREEAMDFIAQWELDNVSDEDYENNLADDMAIAGSLVEDTKLDGDVSH